MSRLTLDMTEGKEDVPQMNPSTLLGTTIKIGHETSTHRGNFNGCLAHIVCATKPATTGRCRAAFTPHHLQGRACPSGIVDARAADCCVIRERIEGSRLQCDGKRRKVRKAGRKMLWRRRSDEKWRRAGRFGAD